MSRAGDVRTVNKVIDAADGVQREGAAIRSKNVQQLRRSAGIPKLKLIKSKKLKMGIFGFVLGFITSTWVNVANRPPPVVVKKVVRKKKPKLTIEELPDEGPVDPNDDPAAASEMAAAARPGEEMKMVLVVNDSLGMSAGEAMQREERARSSPSLASKTTTTTNYTQTHFLFFFLLFSIVTTLQTLRRVEYFVFLWSFQKK